MVIATPQVTGQQSKAAGVFSDEQGNCCWAKDARFSALFRLNLPLLKASQENLAPLFGCDSRKTKGHLELPPF